MIDKISRIIRPALAGFAAALFLLAAPPASRAQVDLPEPAMPTPGQEDLPSSVPGLLGEWPNVPVMSGMKNFFPAAPGELEGDAQITPAIGLPPAAGKSADAITLSGPGGKGFLSVPGQAVDTSGSYTVSAWVKLNRVTGFQTIVAMDGASASAFYLQFRADTHSFAFVTMPKDESANGVTAAQFDPAHAGRWYWLVGVHDAQAKTQSLVVDGALQQTKPYAAAWTAPGPLTIGRAKFNGQPTDYLDGQIADVQLFQGVHQFDPADFNAEATRAASLDQSAATPASVALDLAAPEKPSSPALYGLMIEDIGHSIDGGMYAELIQNRDFRDDATQPAHWTVTKSGMGTGAFAVDATQPPPPGSALTASLRMTTSSVAKRNPREEGKPAPPCFKAVNDGYWGVPIRPETTYRVSFYAKSDGTAPSTLSCDLQSADGETRYADSDGSGYPTFVSPTQKWRKYSMTLRTSGKFPNIADGRFAVTETGLGTVWITHVSVMGPTWNNQANGARFDLMQRVSWMHPAFLRLPGGNFLEGSHIADRFQWKKTIGPTENRPGHANPWGYPSTDGFGLLEYLEWCEDLHMQPVLGVYAGYSLSGEYVKPGPDLAPYVQDALEEIEYVTGDAKTTKWGAVRAVDGHPEPFSLTYVEVGNEDWFDKSGSYDGRFAQFYDAIRAKYPKLQIISTISDVKSRRPDMIDEHYYRSPQDFLADAGHYDKYDRSGPKIFVGEWASQEGTPTPDMGACLGDAAWMCGIERNSDQVLLSAYAPLLADISPDLAAKAAGHPASDNWGTNLIGFDNLDSYGSPTYFAQSMFAAARGSGIVPLQITGNRRLVGSATRADSANGWSFVYLKLVNPGPAAVQAQIAVNGAGAVASFAETATLSSGSPSDTNTLANPTEIAPKRAAIADASTAFTYPLPPYSVTVITLHVRGGDSLKQVN